MSSAFHENLDEQSPLLTDNNPSLPALQPQPTGTTSTADMSRPATPPTAVPSPQPSPSPAPTPTPPPQVATDDATTKKNDPKTPITPTPKLPKATTNAPWGAPAGLPVRGPNDENLIIFRRAVGINSDLSTAGTASTLEAGRKAAVGVYADVLRAKRAKGLWFAALNSLLWLSYFFQVVVGAALTALGPGSSGHPNLITGLGVLNTVIAGFLALIKGQGLPERLRKDEMEYRRLQDWIEETEALLAVGVIGRDRKEVGLLVEWAFKKYNACKASEENNRPESYVPQGVDNGLPGAMTPRLGSSSSASMNVPRY